MNGITGIVVFGLPLVGTILVLLLSTELEEIMELSHRVAVISRGRIVGEMPRAEVDLERLGLLMGGVTEVAS